MLRVTSGDVVLRPAREAHDDALVGVMPDDFEHNPMIPRLDGESMGEVRGRWLRSWLADMRAPQTGPDRTIPFVVEVDGRVAGLQTLEGEAFTRHRIVSSTSFLGREFRRRGLGVAMRTAMLAVAFDRMEAVRAVREATPDNVPSRRISERLRHAHTGRTSDVVTGRERPLDRFELTRERWAEVPHLPVVIDGELPWSSSTG